jgi:plastocyanin
MLLSKFLLIGSPIGVILFLGVVATPLLLTGMSTNSVFVNGNLNAYAQAGQEARPNYFIRINPGATAEGSQHYSIGNAAVPAGTTVVWVNNDQGVRHTVTSGTPGSNTGFFDSGEMPFNAQFPLTFTSAGGLIGEFSYYCTLHPFMVATISSNDTVDRGQSFEFRSGTGPTLDVAKNNRTLLVFNPVGMSVDQPDVMHYNFSITRNSDNQTLYAEEFDVEDSAFGIELIQVSQSEAQAAGVDIPLRFGPDVSIDYTGAYHAAGDFFSQPGDYTLGVDLMTIGSNPPPQQMRDEFTMSVVSGAPATNATTTAPATNATTTAPATNATTTAPATNATTTATAATAATGFS